MTRRQKRASRTALRAVPPTRDPLEHMQRVRARVFHLLKEEEYPPESALALFAGIVGTLAAAQRHGRWKTLWRVWQLYGLEKKRLNAEVLAQLKERNS